MHVLLRLVQPQNVVGSGSEYSIKNMFVVRVEPVNTRPVACALTTVVGCVANFQNKGKVALHERVANFGVKDGHMVGWHGGEGDRPVPEIVPTIREWIGHCPTQTRCFSENQYSFCLFEESRGLRYIPGGVGVLAIANLVLGV